MPFELEKHLPQAMDAKKAGVLESASRSDMAYGCCFCHTGREQLVADRIQGTFSDVIALTARQEKHKTVNGKKSKVQEIILPGYVFFFAPTDVEPAVSFPREYVFRILAMDDGVWQLTGADRRFAQWLFAYNGLLEFSRAYQEGKRIHIVSGPLKDMEGQIARIDRRGRSCQVVLTFNGRSVSAWLGFDLIQPEE